jgi:hypothetical protein
MCKVSKEKDIYFKTGEYFRLLFRHFLQGQNPQTRIGYGAPFLAAILEILNHQEDLWTINWFDIPRGLPCLFVLDTKGLLPLLEQTFLASLLPQIAWKISNIFLENTNIAMDFFYFSCYLHEEGFFSFL